MGVTERIPSILFILPILSAVVFSAFVSGDSYVGRRSLVADTGVARRVRCSAPVFSCRQLPCQFPR